MRFLSRFGLLVVVVCSVVQFYKRVLQVLFGLIMMDFAACLKLLTVSSELKSGFLLLGCFSPAFGVLGLLLMFYSGLKYLQIAWHGKSFIQFLYEIRGKSGDSNNGLSSKLVFSDVFDSKFVPLWFNSLKVSENSISREVDKISVAKGGEDLSDDSSDEGSNSCNEDEEFDVETLRRLVKIERHKAEMAILELEKERMASATAASEAMAMISRLQREKSSIEIEANQFRRFAEQQLAYDDEVIQSLQWTLMKYETEREELVKNLECCKQKLNLLMKSNELDEFNLKFDLDDDDDDDDDETTYEDCLDDPSILDLMN